MHGENKDENLAGLIDSRAYMNTFGCLMQDSTLVEDMDRPLEADDFAGNVFYTIIYSAISNLVSGGCSVLSEFAIDSYISKIPKQYEIFQKNNGLEYLVNAKEMSDLQNYDYYYHKMKKLALLRYYEKHGLDTRSIYNPGYGLNDAEKAREEAQKLDNYTELEITDIVEHDLVLNARAKYCAGVLTQNIQAGQGMRDLVQELMEVPDVGYGFASPGFNTICRGARSGKFYLRSASTSVGKTRNFIMDACNFAVPWYYDLYEKEFVYTGHAVPTVFVGTEGSLEEFQTIALATVSGVDEDHILNGDYDPGEEDRVIKAAEYIEQAPLYMTYCDDFSISDIESIAKRYVFSYQIEIFIFDYLQTSLRLMAEITGKSSVRMQEYQLLIIFATRMKALAERLKICIISGTQLSAEAEDARYKNQYLLQGSKAIAQKVDIGLILSRPNNAEKKKLKTITDKKFGIPEINLLQWCYKVRRGKLSSVIICSHIDLGTMRIKDCFVTDFDFNLIDVDFTQIEVMDRVVKENSKNINEVDELDDVEQIESLREDEAEQEKIII